MLKKVLRQNRSTTTGPSLSPSDFGKRAPNLPERASDTCLSTHAQCLCLMALFCHHHVERTGLAGRVNKSQHLWNVHGLDAFKRKGLPGMEGAHWQTPNQQVTLFLLPSVGPCQTTAEERTGEGKKGKGKVKATGLNPNHPATDIPSQFALTFHATVKV